MQTDGRACRIRPRSSSVGKIKHFSKSTKSSAWSSTTVCEHTLYFGVSIKNMTLSYSDTDVLRFAFTWLNHHVMLQTSCLWIRGWGAVRSVRRRPTNWFCQLKIYSPQGVDVYFSQASTCWLWAASTSASRVRWSCTPYYLVSFYYHIIYIF